MQKVMLVIRDGWGYRKDAYENRIAEANTTNTDKLMKEYPNTLLQASGEAVGVPAGYQGNSEVGHMTIGGGRIIFQSLDRINKAITDGSFFENDKLLNLINKCKQNNKKLHIIGLLQVEGVHAHMDHLLALLDLCKKLDFKNVVVHAITDGRDAPVHDSLKHLTSLEKKFEEIGFGEVATIGGRFFAMDRDKRWERVEKAYRVIAEGKTELVFDQAIDYAKKCHEKDETDEFIKPAKHKDYQGFQENDGIIFYNFRTDRPRELTMAMTEPDFDEFERKLVTVNMVTMTNYYNGQKPEIVFADQPVANFLGEYLASKGVRQLRISETEKYAHVTFFFNGQVEKEYPGEERILIPSPKVETYDKKPEMSVYEIKEEILRALESNEYQLIVTNLVNADMVGHTGDGQATIKALEAVDDCLGQIVNKALEKDFVILVFGDHGNAEDQTEQWRTSHTTNPVPLILASKNEKLKQTKLPEGRGLADIAPTVLKLMDLAKPEEMTGESLV